MDDAKTVPRSFWTQWGRLAGPSLFLLAAIYYEELFLKLYCFHAVTVNGLFFTFLFTLPLALLLGLLCGSVPVRYGRLLLPLVTGLVSTWVGSQLVYYHMFRVFLTIFSVTRSAMVAQSFGDVAMGNVIANLPAILMVAAPVLPAFFFRKALIPDQARSKGLCLRWAAMAAAVQLLSMGLVLLCGGGVLSLRYIYYHTATPELEVQNFGVLTQTQLELKRVLFGIKPDTLDLVGEPDPDKAPPDLEPTIPDASVLQPEPMPGYHALPIDFDALLQKEQDETLKNAHLWFSQRDPTPENLWTGYFEGKDLVWIVAEGFSTLAMDPERTPTLWKLSHQGFVFDNFYTPLWGVSTSDGEYVTTTGLIPKSGVWSYSKSAENYMPFSLGNQFRQKGYRTFAFHDYLYNYYDRDKSHPNMGYEYYAVGQGLELETGDRFPPSDVEMMEKIVPMFVDEEHFMVYCLTVSGHLTYTLDTNAMSVKHWDAVADLPYSEEARCYLACQIELDLALESLLDQLEEAGRLEDTVIVLSGDHYPYGLTDEQYSELLGHPVDPVFEIFKSTLILWSGDMEGTAVHVDKYCSSLDVMPTLANLFGLDYDSRLIMGSDILSSDDALVIFSNYSFINEEGYYNSITDQFTRWDGADPDLDEVAQMVAEVQNRVAFSAAILDCDYYRLALGGPPGDTG